MLPEHWMPHGHCYGWTPDVLVPHVVGSALIVGAYFGIPFLIAFDLKRLRLGRRESFVAILFAAFVLACGVGHLIDIVAIWRPWYRLLAWSHVVTGVVSVITLIVLSYLARQRQLIHRAVTSGFSQDAEMVRIIERRLVAHAHLKAIFKSMPGLHVMFFDTGPDEVVRYVDGTDDEYAHLGLSPSSAVGRPCREWLDEIGAADIYPLYSKVLKDRQAFQFRYSNMGAKSLTRLQPYDDGGIAIVIMLGEVGEEWAKAPSVEELLAA